MDGRHQLQHHFARFSNAPRRTAATKTQSKNHPRIFYETRGIYADGDAFAPVLLAWRMCLARQQHNILDATCKNTPDNSLPFATCVHYVHELMGQDGWQLVSKGAPPDGCFVYRLYTNESASSRVDRKTCLLRLYASTICRVAYIQRVALKVPLMRENTLLTHSILDHVKTPTHGSSFSVQSSRL